MATTTKSFLENPIDDQQQAPLTRDTNIGGRLSAILRTSGMNSPTGASSLQEPRGHHGDRESSLWQLESDTSSSTASSLFLQQAGSAGVAPMSPLFLVLDPNMDQEIFSGSSPCKSPHALHSTTKDNGQTDGHTNCDCDNLTGSHQSSSRNGQIYLDDWVIRPPLLGARTRSVRKGEKELFESSQQRQHHPTQLVMNTTSTDAGVRNGDSLSDTEGFPALEYATAAILHNSCGTAPNKLSAANLTRGCGNPMSHSRDEKEQVRHHHDPVMLKFSSSLHRVEKVQQFCFKEGAPPLNDPHVRVPPSARLEPQPRMGSETMIVRYNSRASQAWHAQEKQPIQETFGGQCKKFHHLQDERCHDVYPSNAVMQQRWDEPKVRYQHERWRSDPETNSDVSCNLALYLDKDTNHMPRPFHPDIGRPQTVIPLCVKL